jgi:sugar lactone lactonase YvrE
LLSKSGTDTAVPPTTFALKGKVHGGQQPVVNSSIRLYAAGTGGYGTPAQSLLSGPGYVLSDANGGFSITGSYTCPSPSTPVYVVASGGNSGSVTANSAISVMAVVGACGSLNPSTFLMINEVSTVAGAYALTGFMSSSSQLSSSGTASAVAGLANAANSVANLVDLATGSTRNITTGSNGVVPQAEINTLGNVLAACVNTGGPSSPPCQTLFTATTPPGGSAPTDTLQAALNIAKYPALNVSTLYDLSVASPPFQPALTAAPNDWTMAVTYTGGGINVPQALAVDAGGNVWVVNTNNALTKLAAGTAAYTFGSTGNKNFGLDAPSGIAVDAAGNIWVSNCGDACSASGAASSVTEITSDGSLAIGAPFTGGGLGAAFGIAVDGASNIWAANTYANSVSKFTNAGAAGSPPAGFTDGGISYPLGLAIDATGSVWTVNPVTNTIGKLTNSGTAAAGSPFGGAGLTYPEGLAIDHSGQVWIASHDANAVVAISNSGGVLSGATGYVGGGISQPNSIAIDGNGAVWVANGTGTGGVSALSNAGIVQSPPPGYLAAGLVYPNGVAVDASGNLWVTGCGSYCSGSGGNAGSVTQFVGIATPVITPLAVGVAANALGTKP